MDGNVWDDRILRLKAGNLEPWDFSSILFISPEEVVFHPSAEDVLSSSHPEILSSLSVTEEIIPSLFAKTSVTFFEGDDRPNSTDGPQDPSVVTSTPITRPKTKQAPCGEWQSMCIV